MAHGQSQKLCYLGRTVLEASRAFAFVAVFVFLTVSTAAIAHGHSDTNDTNESHCVMCIAAHDATHLIAAPPIALHLAQVQIRLLVFVERISVRFAQQLSPQGRAPPRV